jgi:tRNA U54 and U55 pseudouridine synthase Pus10
MTLSERVQVVRLTRALFPNEVEQYSSDQCNKDNCSACNNQIEEWDALIWRVYNALIKVNML